jgi:hypothetical protein
VYKLYIPIYICVCVCVCVTYYNNVRTLLYALIHPAQNDRHGSRRYIIICIYTCHEVSFFCFRHRAFWSFAVFISEYFIHRNTLLLSSCAVRVRILLYIDHNSIRRPYHIVICSCAGQYAIPINHGRHTRRYNKPCASS